MLQLSLLPVRALQSCKVQKPTSVTTVYYGNLATKRYAAMSLRTTFYHHIQTTPIPRKKPWLSEHRLMGVAVVPSGGVWDLPVGTVDREPKGNLQKPMNNEVQICSNSVQIYLESDHLASSSELQKLKRTEVNQIVFESKSAVGFHTSYHTTSWAKRMP